MRSAEVAEHPNLPVVSGDFGYGARGTRTPDLLGAIQALSQLSYSPEEPTVYPGFAAVQGYGNVPDPPIR
jgi:hypothetical protein